ncbi:hypothetical protein AV521_06230 [Streptomyces sp. IMTB 2501]|uniref:hypothetical protein n=1 Tax=Streptomyces sp. IMTB 2501 TaxID=1776340 RepID=UPI00096BF4BF|nr:hypothetical protein [Streptomyces sp. IMTB 2501]OLZ73644.1 hypothetical protein AV521_06230 [Streptomyces sp. IMTB 2501]
MTVSSHARASEDTKAKHPVQDTLAHPVQTVMTAVEKVPGAERVRPGFDRVKGVVDGVLDSVGIVSPHARRVAAYTGAGLLGVAGVVEWPVAAVGAAVVWLTQPRPQDAETAGEATVSRTEGLRAKQAARSAKASTEARVARSRSAKAASGSAKAKTRPTKSASSSGTTKSPSSKRAATSRSSASPATARGRKKS